MSVFDSFFPPTFAAARPEDAQASSSPSTATPSSSGGCGCGCSSSQGPDARRVADTGPAEDVEALERSLNRWTLFKPASLAVFQDYGLDACCGGDRSLAEACRIHGLDVRVVLARLEVV